MLNFTTLASKLKYGIFASILLIANVLSAQTYDANLSLLKFNSSSAKVGNGQSVNDIVVFSNVITIGGQSIDAIIKTLGVTNVTTFDNYDYNTSDADFFAPRLTWGTGGGSFKFNITFIKNGTYNTTTKTGTAVNLINVVMNTYDIDGNGTSGTNQFNEFGDLKRYELGNPTNIVATYNSTTGLTKFRSKIDQNSGTTTADSQRVRVYFDTISSLDFMVGAEGKGLAYYYLDFSVGPTFTTACNLALSTDNATNPSCAGSSTGSISLTTSGGTTPYTYSWSGPSNTKTTEDVTGIPAGSHTITVTDKNSCKQVKTITLTDPTAPTITGSAAVCIGSDITLTGSGTANTSSPWTSSSTSTATVSSSGVVTGIAAGSTTITYKNSAGCTTTKSITVNASPAAAVSPTTATVNFKTAQSITATPSTGVTYAWTPSTGLSSTTTASVTATAAVDTRYLVTVTSTTNGCTDTASCLIKINIFDLATSCPTITKKNNGTTKGSKYVWGYRAKTTAYSVASGSLEMQFPNGTPAKNIPFVKAIYTNGVLDNSVDFDYPMVDMTNGYDSTFPSNAKVYYNFYSTSKSGNLGNGNIVTIEFTDSFAATRAGRKEQTRMCAYDLSGGAPAVIPTPTITTNLAASYSDCKGANRTLSIKASLGTSGNTLSYQWYKNNVLMTSRTKDTLILANVQTTYSGDYHCIVKETNTSSVVVASVKSNITTYTVSAPTVTVSPTTATINVGSSQTLTASGASTYTWTPSTGLSATTGTTVTASPTVTTTYTVTGTAVSGCTNTATSIITVNTPLTGGKIAGSQSVCSGGDPTAFTSTTAASGGTGSITYQWQQSTDSGTTFTDISTANSATYDVAAGITATTLYRRKATDAASTIKYSDTVTIAVNALPTITGTTNACIGASTTLTGSGTAATSNAWVSASTGVATISTSGVVTGVSAGTSVITYTNSNGCSKTETITINALPTISGSAEVCVGATSTLTGSGTAATTTPWATSNSAVASITSSGVMTGASAGTATITYTNSNGCSITANAVVNSLPTITGSTSVCQYATLSLTGSGTAASSSPWSSSNTSVAKVSNTGTVTGISGGTTTISYTNNKGCTETQIITVNGQPSVSVSPSSATISPGGSQSLTASGGSSYSWSPSATLSSSTGSSVTATPSTTTTYDVIGTDSKGCADTAQVTVTVLSSLSAGTIAGSQTICFGADPTAFTSSAAPSGGTGSLTTQWQKSINAGSTWSDISGATSSTYDESSSIAVTTSYRRKVTDGASNIDYSNTITITINSKPNASLSASQVSCYGGSNGAITTTLTGGTSPFTYSWSGSSYSATTKDISSLSAGSYTLICTDNNGCKDTASVSVTEPSAALSIGTPAVTAVGCKGASTGAINLTISGGTTAYSFAWSGPSSYTASTEDISSLAAGTYSVTVTDANGCTATNASVSVTEPSAALSIGTPSITAVGCKGASTGAINLTISGGTTAYSYAWTGPSSYTASTEDISSLAAGTYSVTVTDANGCTATNASVSVTEPAAALSLSNSAQTNVLCYGNSTGAVTVAAAGGTSPYEYKIGSGSYGSSATFSSLAAGSYTITAKDANGCTQTLSVTITEPSAALSIGTPAVTAVGCKGASTGAVDLTVTGGTSAYSYAWTGPSSYTASTEDISSLAAGTYSVTVTDANGCTATNASVSLTEPSAALSLSNSAQTNVLCFGNSTGAVTVAAAGGTSPYEYKIGSGSYGSSATFSSLAAGSYTITAKDANGCTQTLSVTITEPSAALSIGTPAVTAVGCKGASTGAVNLTISGGTSAYSYAWTGPSSYTASTEDISSLAAGTYSVTVTDANGCTATNASVSVTEPSAALSLSNSAQTNVLCYGNSTGAVTVAAAGGTSPYEYKIGSGSYGSSATFSSLTAGSYTITAKDANGCTQTLSVTITEPSAALSIGTPTVTAVGCKGASTGAINLTISGGTSAYSYAWTGPSSYTASTEDISSLAAGTYSVTVTDANGCTATNASVSVTEPSAALSLSNSAQTNVLCYGNSTGAVTVAAAGGTSPYEYKIGSGSYSSSATFSSLAAGSYTITTKDANGCTQTLSVTITEPSAALSIGTPTVTAVGCKGASTGAVDLTVTGGTSAYSYAWTGPSSYTASTEDISSLAAGTYSVTVTDANGCTATNASVSVTEPSAALSIGTPTVTAVGCKGASTGAVDLTVTGGTSAYSYAWTGPSSYTASTEDISSLAAGTYSVTVTDANGCTATNASVSVTEPSAALSLSNSAQTNVLCYGNSTGAVTVAAAGGTSPYEYKIGSGSYGSSATFSSLAAGSYTITAKDANGCTQTLSVTITEPSAALSIGTPSITAVGCKGASTGAINLTISGGTTAYSYAWTGPSSYTASTEDISSLAAGTYSVTVTDANGCTATNASVSVTEPSAALSLSNSAQTNVLCYGNSTGAVTVAAAGGTSPYEYKIGSGSYGSSATFSSLAAGSYTITAKDANGCTQTLSVTITEPSAALSIGTPSITAVGCKGASTGAINLTISGGTTAYSYAWTGPSSYTASTEDISSLAAGTYSVTVTDANGCTATNASVSVTEPSAALSLSNSAQTNVLCFGNSTGAVTVAAAGGTSPYEYKIGSGSYSSSATFSSLAAGSYTITTKDANGCTQTLSVTITEPSAALSIGTPAVTAVGCKGASTGAVDLTVTGGTSAYSYAWTGPSSYTASTEDISSLAAGTYSVTVTDANGCTATNASVSVTEPSAALSLSNSAQTNVLCYGNSTGAVTVAAAGGTSPYEYKIGSGSYSSSATFSSLAAGSYTITTKDANGCTQTLSVIITEPSAAISVSAITSTNISCNGGNDGTITITATGGTTLKYSIDNGSTFQSSNLFSGLAAGNYTVVVSDNNNCSGSFATGVSASVTLTEPNAISVSAITSTDPTCISAKDGTITITATGGNTLSYSIDNGTTFQSSNIFTGLGVGTYTINLSDSKLCLVSYGSVNTTVVLSNGDITKPVVITKNYSAYLNAAGNITISYLNVDNGSYDNCEIKSIYLDDSTFDCTNLGSNTVTLTVTDIAGNTNSNTATVTVYDTISPAPKAKDLVVYLDATGNVSITAAQADNGSTDNCSIKTLSLSKSNFSCADTGVNNSIKFTATDYSNRTAYTFFNVRVYDTISPTPKAKNLVVYLDATGNVSINAAQANNGSTDNCSIKTLSLSKSNFSCADTGVNNSIKFTATDYSNRTAYTYFNVRVYDTISPAPKAKDLVVYLDATGNVSITAAQANNGSTDNCSIKTLSLSKSNFSCADTGVNNSIKFTATDYSNNTAYTYFNVRVYDTISPAPKAKDLVVYLDATGNVSITAAQANNGSTDNCSIKTLSLSKSNFSCADTGVNNSIKFTATDYSNNTAYTYFNVRVYDTISPAPKAKDLVVYLDATGNVSITAAQANNGSTDNCSIKTLSLSKSNFSCADTGVNNSIKFTATDYSNRTAYTFFNVRVYDTISPTPKAKNLVVYLDATGNVSITAAQANNGSTDNCSIKTLSLSNSNFSCADTGVNNSIKFTATDYSNNTAYTYFNVRIYDTISPIPSMPDFVVYLNAMGTADIVNPALGYDRSTDNCATKSWTIDRKTLTCADTGIDNAVKLTIKDRSDNTAYTYFNVRVYDTISPAPKAKNLVVYLDATGNVSITAAQADNGSTDNCSIKTLSISRSNFTCTDTGTHKGIVFTAVDYSNNTAYTTFDVTVLDTIKPTITVKTAVVYLDTAAKANLTKAMFTVSTNDNCGVIDTTISRYFVTLADTGWLDIDVWVKDKNNNVTGPVKTKVLVLIADSDNDSIPDYIEGSKDFDGDGVFDYADLDSDNDGILDVIENEAKDSLLDLDSDGQPNFRDLDTDNDGIDDIIEVDGSDSDFDGVAGNGKPTVDANGVPTIANGGYKEVFTDADLLPDYKDLDTDDDGIIDNTEKGPGKNPVDTDGDGKGDWRDLDTDNDGISDKTETDIDTDGDGTGDWRDLDTDNDGISDKIETDVDTDGDGKGDWRDLDSDNDGISDKIETDIDTDGDGTGDWRDLDTDNDGISDKTETDINTDGDGTGDWRDLDTDNDGISDKIETDVDTDGDGKGDWRDLDSDNDGISDKIETDIDTDGDGTGDWRDLDTDNDGISDKIETDVDTDGDGKGDWRDLDSDNDQIPDKIETDIDTDGDGKGDWRDLDSDNDTIPDTKEAGDDPNNPTDTDGDGNADFRELDSDNDELPDELEGLQDSKTPNIWIPEGISPNGDGINDLLYIKGLANFKNASVLIFNRWGQIVYESGPGYTNLNGFDGYYHGKGLSISTDQPLPENVYFLVFKSNDEKGLTIKQNLYIKAN